MYGISIIESHFRLLLLSAPVVYLQSLEICTGLRCIFSKAFHHFRIVAVDDAVGKAVREVFSGVGFGIVSQRRGGSFRAKELFMLCGESQRPIEEMSEFMERRAGIRDVDGFLAVVGGSNAAHVQLLAEFADVVEVDTVCPASHLKGGKHRLRHLPQRQQVVIDVDACRVH